MLRRLLRLALWASLLPGVSGLPVLAADDPPQPAPVAGELRTHMDLQVRGQVARPLAVGDGSALLFQEEGGALVLWRIFPVEPARSQRTALPAVRLDAAVPVGGTAPRPPRYASLATAAGVWLVGPTSWLIRPDGRLLSVRLQSPRHRVSAVPQPDGSLLVLGGLPWPERNDTAPVLPLERLQLDPAGALRTESLALPPADLGPTPQGVHLGMGRVLAVSGTHPGLSRVYDAARGQWSEAARMQQRRSAASLLLLPDGRVWAAGGENDRDAATSSELWDPQTRQWQPGPDLPVPMQDHQAVWLPGPQVALLGAGRWPLVVGWTPGNASAVVAAQAGIERRDGALVPLPGQRLGLVSGVSARTYDEAWGRRSPGASVVPWSLPMNGPGGAWQLAREGGLVVREQQALAVGGQLMHAHEGSEALVPTRLAERLALGTAPGAALPPLPVSVVRAQAAWLDPRWVLVHAEQAGDGLIAWLGLLELPQGRWRALDAQALGTRVMSDGVHGRLQLLGADRQRAWLVGEDAAVHWVDAGGRLSQGLRLQRQRSSFTGRVLADGRVVVAGGLVEGELVASRPAGCLDCPVRYVGWGAQLPARRHEIFDPATQAWTASAPARAAGPVATVLADGRVAKAGTLTERVTDPQGGRALVQRSRALLELSSADGSAWRPLPWPAEAAVPESGEGLRLLAPLGDDGGPLPTALFLGLPQPGGWHWWWLPSVDAADAAWKPLARSVAPFTFPPGELALEVPGQAPGSLRVTGSAAGVVVYRRP